ncbi:DNA damage-binding protein 1 [Rhodotorula toruloides]|nr:DNA damage-binding protein 1 [Rhodotorula toruloides]
MLYAATTQQATAQLGALRCAFFEPSQDCLVVNKLNRLEFSSIEDDAVNPLLEVPLFSTIASMQSGQATASLVVLTTCLRLFALVHDPTSPYNVKTVASVSIAEPFGRLAEYQDILVDPANRCLLVHAYAGLVRVVPFFIGDTPAQRGSRTATRLAGSPHGSPLDFSYSYNVRLPILNVASLAIVASSADDPPILAGIHIEHTGTRTLSTFAISLKDKDLCEGPVAAFALADPGSELVLPVNEANAPGILVAGEETVTWVSLEERNGASSTASKGKGRAASQMLVSCRLPVARITAWSWRNNDRLLLGDIYGKLFEVNLRRAENGVVSGISAQDVGDAASASAIVPLGATTVYLASRFGDSQIVRFVSGEDEGMAGPAELALVDSISNIAPIVDLCIVSAHGQAANYAVTCSGAYKTGSLRVIRRGVGLSELAALEADGVQQAWSLTSPAPSTEPILVLGFFSETRVFRMSAGDPAGAEAVQIDEMDLQLFASPGPTIFAGNVGSMLVRVTAEAVMYASDRGEESWKATSAGKITAAAAAGGDHLVLAFDGGFLQLLKAKNGTFTESGNIAFEHDIASVSLAETSAGAFAVVGLWTSQAVHLVGIPDLAVYASQKITSTFLIRSAALINFGDGDYTLFVGLGDGTLASYRVDLAAPAVIDSTGKMIALGRRPLLLSEIGPESAKGVSSVANISHPALGDLVALVSREGVQIGRMDTVQKVDVRTVPLAEDEPRRIVYDPVSRKFCVACSRRDIDRHTGQQAVTSVVRLVSEDSFETSSVFELERGEEAQSLALVESQGTVAWSSSPFQKLETCVKFRAPVSAAVAVWTIDSEGALALKSTWSGAFVAYTLARAPDDTLIVGDALRSLTVLRYTASPQPKLLEVAKDYRSRYMVGVEDLGRDSTGADRYIGAETDLNLFAVSRHPQQAAGNLANAATLQDAGAFHLGELVTRFRTGSLGDLIGDANTTVVPRLVYSTSAGTIGVIADLDAASSRILSDLERNMREFVKGVGGLEQEEYRAFKADKVKTPSTGFIDGDFVQSFLDLSKDVQEQVMQGKSEHERLTVDKAEIVRLLEEVARVH